MGRIFTPRRILAVIVCVAAAVAAYLFYSRSSDDENFQKLKAGDLLERISAFKRLEQAKSFNQKAAFIIADDGDETARRMGIFLLAEHPDKRETLNKLQVLLEKNIPEERPAILFAFGESGIKDAIPILKSMLVDPDETTRGFARHAIGKLTHDDGTYPNWADCVYGYEMTELFGNADAEIQPSVILSVEFISKLLLFIETHTSLSLSGIKTEKIKIKPKTEGSTYNSSTGEITLGYFDGATPGIMLSQLIHEIAVANMGGREKFGPKITPTFAHDLAVLTELAYSPKTCVSRHYLSKQIDTIESLWTRYTAEEMLIRCSLHRNGQKTNSFSIKDITVCEDGITGGAVNYAITIEFAPDMVLKKYEIIPIK